jgi:hypothetical protein
MIPIKMVASKIVTPFEFLKKEKKIRGYEEVRWAAPSRYWVWPFIYFFKKVYLGYKNSVCWKGGKFHLKGG